MSDESALLAATAVDQTQAVETSKVQWMQPWLPPRGHADALCAAVDALLCQWKTAGMMARIEPSLADPAWDVSALREIVLLDARSRAIWEDGDRNRELKPNDALSHAVRAGINKVFEVAQVPAKAVGSRRERLGHLQSCTSSEARVWTELRVSDELRALWQERAAAARHAPADAKLRMHRAEHTRARWLESEDQQVVEGARQHGTRSGCAGIAARLPGRSTDAVRNRWFRLKEQCGSECGSGLRSDLRTSSASALSPEAADEEEDAAPGVGSALSSCGAPLQRLPPCRRGWTAHEDGTIVELARLHGAKWRKIAGEVRLPAMGLQPMNSPPAPLLADQSRVRASTRAALASPHSPCHPAPC